MAAKVTAAEQTQEVRRDPMKEMVDVFLTKGGPGEANFQFVCLNGVPFQVPRGKRVSVPRPIYEILARSEDAREYTDAFDEANAQVIEERV